MNNKQVEETISNNINLNDSSEVKNLKERIYYARLAASKANTKEKSERNAKELDELLAKLEKLQPKVKSQWNLFKEKYGMQGGKRKTRKSKKSRKAKKATRKH
jgi:uncharacterized protein YecE (DUF72 family)